MIQFNVFPSGKKKIVTFSYDDGSDNDIRLVELFNQYNLKSTFHLNSGRFWEITSEKAENLRKRYKDHEISCHTVSHGWPALIPNVSLVGEVLNDRRALERITQYPVVGMSYPSGDFSNEAIKTMESCGIVYSRTVHSTFDFKLPYDFMHWNPTCHHNNAMQYIELFLANIDSPWRGPLLYIWGHSHEFVSEELWMSFERAIEKIANNDKIWYATNIEIYNYIKAQRSLVISADEKIIYNPSAIPVWVEKNKSKIIKIEAGQTYIDR